MMLHGESPSPWELPIAELLGLLERGSAPCALSVQVPVAPIDPLFRALPQQDALLWSCPPGFAGSRGLETIGLGVARSFAPRGSHRFRILRDEGTRWLAGLRLLGSPAAPAPLLLGGLSFAPGSADAEPWERFGDAWFVLPRWRYSRDGERGWLTLCLTEREPPDLLADEARRILALLARPREESARPIAAPLDLRSWDDLPLARWLELVGRIQTHFARGSGRAIEKVVLARRSRVDARRAIDPSAVLAGLDTAGGTGVRFAFRLGASTFLGRTPELLVARTGRWFATEALAGTLPAAHPDVMAALLASAKERHEHELVRSAIVAALSPLCRTLDAPAVPTPRRFHHAVHLRTMIRGETDEEVHLLDLAERIHPTPAVGGVPRQAALNWIVENEPAPRGWYSGPVGWFDAAGDGELAVALRCGLLTGETAWFWAGAGIVEGSDPEGEYHETALKQRAFAAALGVDR